MRRKPLFPPPKDSNGRPKRHKGRQKRSVLTVNGRVALRRIRWHSAAEGSTTPIDAVLDAAEATISLAARELACRLNQNASNFDKAAENLAHAAQVRMSGETLRRLVEAEGKAVLAVGRAGTLVIGWTAADCRTRDAADPTKRGPARVYLGCDGVLVPMVTDAEKVARRKAVRQKRRRRGTKARPLPPARAGADQGYKEFKIVAYYDEDQSHRHVMVTRGDHHVAGRMMRHEAGRIALSEAQEKIALADGAVWIGNQIRSQNLPLDAVGLDFYHLSEHVHKARRAVFGESEAGKAWASTALHTVKHEGYDVFWESLTQWRAPLRGRRRKAADELLHYVAKRSETICYPEFLAKGWQIGSGPTEAICKTTTARLKGSGMRWDGTNAEAVMGLAALEQSDQWKQYWRICLEPTG
jgi:hypothetical protein